MQAAAARDVRVQEEEVLALLLAEAAAAHKRAARHEPRRHQQRALAEAVQQQLLLAHLVGPRDVARSRALGLAAHACAHQRARPSGRRQQLRFDSLRPREVVHVLLDQASAHAAGTASCWESKWEIAWKQSHVPLLCATARFLANPQPPPCEPPERPITTATPAASRRGFQR